MHITITVRSSYFRRIGILSLTHDLFFFRKHLTRRASASCELNQLCFKKKIFFTAEKYICLHQVNQTWLRNTVLPDESPLLSFSRVLIIEHERATKRIDNCYLQRQSRGMPCLHTRVFHEVSVRTLYNRRILACCKPELANRWVRGCSRVREEGLDLSGRIRADFFFLQVFDDLCDTFFHFR